MYNYTVLEDDAGLYLFVYPVGMNETESVYVGNSFEYHPGELRACLQALNNGSCPLEEGWDWNLITDSDLIDEVGDNSLWDLLYVQQYPKPKIIAWNEVDLDDESIPHYDYDSMGVFGQIEFGLDE